MRDAIELLARALLHFGLLAVVCVAAGAVAIRRGIRDVVVVGLVELTAIGAVGYLAFWVYFLTPKVGHAYSLLVPIGAGLSFLWGYRGLDVAGRAIMRRLFLPLALSGAAALLVLSTGFLYGGTARPFETAAVRFSHPLPGDNRIPYDFAEGLRDGHVPSPLHADWLSSDRPPLQTGCVLAQYTYLVRPRQLGYSVLSTELQSLWIFAAWLLCEALGLSSRAVRLAIAVSLFSGFVFLNSFYVWPKLFAASYSLAFLVPVFAARFFRESRPMFWVLTGAMLAFSELAHGAATFAFLGAVVTLLVLRRRMAWRSVAIVAVTGFVLYVPWTLYQKFYDPPGTRLLKMHLAGVNGIDDNTFLQDFISAYHSVTPQQLISNKWENVKCLYRYFDDYWRALFQSAHYWYSRGFELRSAESIRSVMFYIYGDNLAFLIVGPLALMAGIRKRNRTPEWRSSATMWVFIALTLFIWCVLLFRPGTTIIHSGAYVTVVLGYMAGIFALWAVSPVLAAVIGGLQMLLNVLLYGVWGQAPSKDVLGHAAAVEPGFVALSLLSLACVVALLGAEMRGSKQLE